jgi:hypothetical protein
VTGATHLRLVPRLRREELYLSFPHMPSWRGQGQLYLACIRFYDHLVEFVFFFLIICFCVCEAVEGWMR